MESLAPDGYLLNNTKLYFEITKNGEEVALEMLDKPVLNKDYTFDVPDTLDINFFNNFIIIISSLFLGTYYVNKKEN